MSTYYITEIDVSFKLNQKYLKIYYQQELRICAPIRNISKIFIFSGIQPTQELTQLAYTHQIPIIYLTPDGEFIGRVENSSQAQAKYSSYQREQAKNSGFKLAITESIVWAKLSNQQTVLQNQISYNPNSVTHDAINYLKVLIDDLSQASSLEELRQYSEEADKIYYGAIASQLSLYKPHTYTAAKSISTLFNLGNQLLHQNIYSLVRNCGLDPNYAILEFDVNHDYSLTWDLCTEFSPVIVDDLVLNFARSIHHLNGNGKKQTLLQRFLQHWEAKLRTLILHPYVGEVSYRQCMELQVQEYLASLLGEVEYYRPLALKLHPKHSQTSNIVQLYKLPLTVVK